MYFQFNTQAKTIAGLLVSLFMVTAAQAVMPEPINPKDAANMNFDQRLTYLKTIQAASSKSTPQEVADFWKKYAAKVNALSPADQTYVSNKLKANKSALTPEQKKTMGAEQAAYVNSLTPAQKAALQANVAAGKLN
ncbi:hypothetical protein G6717_02265 [Polynucleobacter paneuropaeus]|nr:hypothetical protein [Polynucleobacter paneuropaeus]